jgi:hypothetical protein
MEEEDVLETLERRKARVIADSAGEDEEGEDNTAAMWDDDLGGVQIAPPVVLSRASTGSNEEEAVDKEEKPGSDSPLSDVSNVSALDHDESSRKRRRIGNGQLVPGSSPLSRPAPTPTPPTTYTPAS